MAQPTTYDPATDFSAEEASSVGGRSTVRTAALDAELSAIQLTLDGVLTNLSLNQRDDGEIRDARVKVHTLASDVLALLTTYGATPRGAWQTTTSYAVKDLVSESANTYIAVSAHTSGTFATDLAAGKWLLFTLGSATAASSVTFAPSATLAATNVQAAIEEADTEGRALSAALVAAFGVDLADATSATKGAVKVGYDPTLAYASGLGLFLNNLYARTAAEVTAGVTPTYYYYPPGDPRRYGAAEDGVTDDTTSLQRWASVAHSHFLNEGKTYYITGALSLPAVLDGRGATISCSAAASISRVGTLTQIADLSVSPSEGDQTLTFASAHTLTQDDVIVIYNPTNSSFSSARTYYRAGEFCRVATVPSTTTIDLTEPLKAGYTAANVDVYKLTRNDVAWSNLNIIGPDATVSALKLSLATRAVLRNVRVRFASYLGIYVDRCFDYTLIDCHTNVPKTAISDCYGLLHGNSQNGKVIGGTYYSLSNSIDHGGDDLTGCVPVRNIVHTGCSISNDNGVSAEAANTHGNAVGIRFESCFIQGGASLNGKDIEYVDCTIGGAPAGLRYLVGGGSEMIGGRYSVSNCKLKAGGAYSNGLVRAYNGVNCAEANHLIVEDNDVDMGSCDTFVRTDMESSTYKSNARVDGVVFTDGAASLANVCRMVGTGAGGDGDYVIVDRVTNGPAGAILYVATSSYGSTVKVRLQEQRGSVAITPVSGAALANSASQTFRYSYGSRTPQCSVDLASGTVNSKTVIGYPSSVSATAIIATMRTCDSTNMGVTSPDVTAYWTASVNEI